jgi:hypothetical protein
MPSRRVVCDAGLLLRDDDDDCVAGRVVITKLLRGSTNVLPETDVFCNVVAVVIAVDDDDATCCGNVGGGGGGGGTANAPLDVATGLCSEIDDPLLFDAAFDVIVVVVVVSVVAAVELLRTAVVSIESSTVIVSGGEFCSERRISFGRFSVDFVGA